MMGGGTTLSWGGGKICKMHFLQLHLSKYETLSKHVAFGNSCYENQACGKSITHLFAVGIQRDDLIGSQNLVEHGVKKCHDVELKKNLKKPV